MMDALFTFLIAVQFLVVVMHDLIDIPGWTHGSQVQAVVGRNKLLWATLINALFPGAAVALAVRFWSLPKPVFVVRYWIVYCALTLASAVIMWYVPYFFGAKEQIKREYARMYEGTRHVLPPRGENPRPNLLHICFHILFVVNFLLVLAMARR